MREDCERARREIERRLVEGEGEAAAPHCEECAAFEREIQAAIGTVRRSSVQVPADLAFRTRFRVSLRAREMRARPRWWALGISLGLSWAVGIASAPLVWRGFEWLGRSAGIPQAGITAAFGLWWAAPAAIAGGVWMWERKRVEEE